MGIVRASDDSCNNAAIEARIAGLERELRALADADPVVMRLRTIPGIGLLTATALVGTVGHIHAFRRARQFASWLGLTPREYSSGQCFDLLRVEGWPGTTGTCTACTARRGSICRIGRYVPPPSSGPSITGFRRGCDAWQVGERRDAAERASGQCLF